MAYDCIPENFGMPLQPGQHFWGRIEGMRTWANSIVSIAKSTTRDVLDIYQLPPSIIRTTHTRIDGNHFKPATQDQIAAFKAEYSIDKPYFLLVGERSHYKHLEPFFYAVNLMTEPERNNFIVLTVGGDPISAWEAVRYHVIIHMNIEHVAQYQSHSN